MNKNIETISIYSQYRENIKFILIASNDNMPFIPIRQLLNIFKPILNNSYYKNLIESLKDKIYNLAKSLGYIIETDNRILIHFDFYDNERKKTDYFV